MISDDLDKKELGEYYLKLVGLHKKDLRRLYFFVVFTIIAGIFLVSLRFIFLFDDKPRYGEDKDYWWTIGTYSLVAMLILVFILTYRRLTKFRRDIARSNAIKAQEIEETTIGKIVQDLQKTMNISDVCIWISQSNSTSPSIIEEKGIPQLVLPEGILKLARTSPESAKALIAHEFGHIIQEDTKLILWIDFFTERYLWIFGSSILAIAIFWLIVTVLQGPVPVPMGLTIGAAICHSCIQIRLARKRCEYLADLSAGVFASPEHYLQLLRQAAADAERNHPASIRRADVLERSILLHCKSQAQAVKSAIAEERASAVKKAIMYCIATFLAIVVFIFWAVANMK